MKNSITLEQSKKFDQFISKWQRELNLNCWRIVREAKPSKNMAEVVVDLPSRMAMYRLGDNFGIEPITDYSLESTACHELLHVLLSEYRAVIISEQSDEIIQATEHRIVHTLENLLVPKP